MRIVEALRAEQKTLARAGRLLETVDDFGMHMICADELDAVDLANFAAILRKLQLNKNSDEVGFNNLLEDLCNRIAQDERLRQPNR